MMSNNKTPEIFSVQFVESGSELHLELINGCDQTLKSVEILTVFLKDAETSGGPSRAHIRFEDVKSIQPKERTVVSHKTWIDGQPAPPQQDQLERLKVVPGEARPYVLDLAWEDPEGKARFQRIQVGH